MGKVTSQSLPFFHALTGSDTTSAFRGKGKKTAWQAWSGFELITPIFQHYSQNPFESIDVAGSNFKMLQKFVIRMYSKTIDTESINEGRKVLFALNKNVQKIPPTEDSLFQHVKRAIFQTGRITSNKAGYTTNICNYWHLLA